MVPPRVAEAFNLFRHSGPVPVADPGEVTELLDLACAGNDARLAGRRRDGKTSLLRAAPERPERDRFAVVYVDFFGALNLDDIA